MPDRDAINDDAGVESQPTQVLHELLGSSMEAEEEENPDSLNPKSQQDESQDAADSASESYTAPSYHLFGLAATQTQTQSVSRDGDSTASKGLVHQAEPPASPVSPVHKPTFKSSIDAQARPAKAQSLPHTHFGNPEPIRKHASSPGTSKGRLGRKPPSRGETKSPLPSRSTRQAPASKRHPPSRKRSPSLASEDSFAAPAPFEDPQQAFVAANPQFARPLSERDPPAYTQEESVGVARGLSSASSSFSVMRALTQVENPLSPTSSWRASSPTPASGDVDATPKKSNESQGSQPSEHSQSLEQDSQALPRGQDPHGYVVTDENMTQLSTPPVHSSDPASSIEGLSIADPGNVSSQSFSLEPTQIIDSNSSDAGVTQPVQIYTTAGPFAPSGQSAATTTTTTAPRTLLSMVNPNKKWRIQQHTPAAPSTAPAEEPQVADHSYSDGLTQVSESSANVTRATGGRLFEALTAGKSERVDEIPEENEDGPSPSLAIADETDIVPDSEPAQPHSSDSPQKSRSPILSPGLRRQQVPDSEPRSSYLTPPKDDGDGDDDDDDVPLANIGRHTRKAVGIGKGTFEKQAQSRTKPQTSKGKKVVEPKARRSPQNGQLSRQADSIAHEVPSSVPQQDLGGRSASSALAAPPSTNRLGSRSSQPSRTPITPKKSDAGSSLSPLSEDGDDARETQDPLDLFSIQKEDEVVPKEEEETTEPADDIPMDVDEDDPEPPPATSSGRKRKRSIASPVSKAPFRIATRASKTPSVANANARPAKRLRGQSSARRTSLEATRVFARWPGPGQPFYYSGVVHSYAGNSQDRFVIHFDDGDKEKVDIKSLRKCDVAVGDNIALMDDQKAVVVDAGLRDHGKLGIRKRDGSQQYVEMQTVKISARDIQLQWTSRQLLPDEIVPMLQPKTLADTPSPSKHSVLSSAVSAKGSRSKLLAGMGFVVTFSVGCEGWDKLRVDATRKIKDNGGVVLEDWSAIFQWGERHQNNSKRCVVEPKDFKTKLSNGVEQVFLLSDNPSQKQKYLIALALGIPCLSLDWLDSIAHDGTSKWTSYLLPAGFCEAKECRLGQKIDWDWGTSVGHLTEIMLDNVPPKVFDCLSFLVVGPDSFPPPQTGKGKKASSGLDGSQTLHRIILCMGAAYVEAVPELRFSSRTDLTHFDYVVVKDLNSQKTGAEATWVSSQWVKDCLIAGGLVPLA
ncbi:hypothetical protein BV25DRAFT_1821814 [Artomyces pyxidatus]|uniref:Uncharacterized protein n=1 Tax=Artomyces pyxidatus TaxID=48021 RepID=A0ACB8TA85_9AGAM|nr:hypothetical protein BV25DRAFT_1821814 [Artomyces pyxidatus]